MSLYSAQEVLVLAGPSLRHLKECVYLEIIIIAISRTRSGRKKNPIDPWSFQHPTFGSL